MTTLKSKKKPVAPIKHSIELTEPVNALLTWSLLKSFGNNIIATCRLSATIRNAEYSIKVVKVPQGKQGKNKKDDTLCRCIRLDTSYIGNFALFDGESVIISIVLGEGTRYAEMTMATSQIVYRQADMFEEAYVKCIDSWEMSLEVKQEQGENHEYSGNTTQENIPHT